MLSLPRSGLVLHDDCVKIKKENGKQEDYPLAEIFAILRWLTGRFGADYFPLANNVEKLWHDEEADGLGVAILRQQPKKDTPRAGIILLGSHPGACRNTGMEQPTPRNQMAHHSPTPDS